MDSLYNTYQVDAQREGRLPEELRAGEPGGEKSQGLAVQAEAGASGAARGGVRRLLQHNHAPPRRDEGVGARQPCYAAAHHHRLGFLLLFHGGRSPWTNLPSPFDGPPPHGNIRRLLAYPIPFIPSFLFLIS